jgi:hypothetical protein
VSRITATISIARQAPSAFSSPPAVPHCAATVHVWRKIRQDNSAGGGLGLLSLNIAGERLAALRDEMNAAKGALLAFTCILIAGTSNATADELLDLGTRDLAEMKTVSGITVVFDPGKISMVYTLPRSMESSHSRSGSITNIIGLSGGPQEVGETADSLLDRLNLRQYFILLTLTDGIPVWVKASSVSFFRAIEPWDHIRAEAKSAVNAAGRPIFVKENVTTIKDAINAIRRQNRSP